jgi:hypothetical protein
LLQKAVEGHYLCIRADYSNALESIRPVEPEYSHLIYLMLTVALADEPSEHVQNRTEAELSETFVGVESILVGNGSIRNKLTK